MEKQETKKTCWELESGEQCHMAHRVKSCDLCPEHPGSNLSRKIERRSNPRNGIKKVMVIDDEWLIRWSLQRILKKQGFDVVIAGSVDEALSNLKDSFFDCLLIDNYIHGHDDGFTIAEEARRYHPRSTLILMTAFGNADVRKRALNLGIKYLEKPLEMETISESLN